MSVVLDGIVVFVLLMSVWMSYRRGLVKTIVSVVGYFLSFFVAEFLGQRLADFLFDNCLSKPINDRIVNTINNSLSAGGINRATYDLSHILPDWLAKGLLNGQTLPETTVNMLNQNNIEGAAGSITVQVVKPVVVVILSLSLFFIIFLVLRFLLHYIFKITGVIRKMPVVGTINGLLGGVLGVAKAALYLIMIAVLVWIIIIFTSDSLPYLNTDTVNNTNLFLLFYKLNPFMSLV